MYTYGERNGFEICDPVGLASICDDLAIVLSDALNQKFLYGNIFPWLSLCVFVRSTTYQRVGTCFAFVYIHGIVCMTDIFIHLCGFYRRKLHAVYQMLNRQKLSCGCFVVYTLSKLETLRILETYWLCNQDTWSQRVGLDFLTPLLGNQRPWQPIHATQV